MNKYMIILVCLFLNACGVDPENYKKNLPWMVSNTAEGSTRILGVEIGNTSFKELMFELKLLGEPALFESPDGKLTLEAYFGKKKFGALEARLIAEMDADESLLKKMQAEHMEKDSTPSNHWKYSLNVENTRRANDLRVWRLIYLPISDYEEKQLGFFGKPEEVIKINETAEYRLYPSKGVAVLSDTAGKEIFYYVALKDFARLRQSLPNETVMKIE